MKILLVEDDLNKLQRLSTWLSEQCPGANVLERRSYQSGLKSILTDVPEVIVLDMTLPTFDVSSTESGGKPRPFAGREILSEMARKGVEAKAIVVTQFDIFGEGSQKKTLVELDDELLVSFPGLYLGAVYYHPAQTDWKAKLRDYLSKIVGPLA